MPDKPGDMAAPLSRGDGRALEKCPTCDHELEPAEPGKRWCAQCEVVIYGYSEDFEGRGFEEDGFDV